MHAAARCLVVSIFLTCGLHADPVPLTQDEIASMRRELGALRSKYTPIQFERTTTAYSGHAIVSDNVPIERLRHSPDVDRETWRVRYAARGNQFRIDQLQPNTYAYAFDGATYRTRTATAFFNDPRPRQYAIDPAYPMPHAAVLADMLNQFFLPDFGEFFRRGTLDALPELIASPDGSDVSLVECTRLKIDGRSCVRLRWPSRWQRQYTLTLAKDHDWMPVRFQAAYGERFVHVTVSDLMAVDHMERSIWFPRSVRMTSAPFNGPGTSAEWITDSEFRLIDEAPAADRFRSVDAPTEQSATPAVTLSRGTSNASFSGTSIGLLALVGLSVLVFALRSRWVRELVRRRLGWFHALGILCIIATAAGLSTQQGWWQHGLALVVAGAVGLLYGMLLKAVTRQPWVSIRELIGMSTCVAMILAGYHGGLSTLHHRRATISAIEAAGGSIDYLYRRKDESTLTIPPYLTQYLGEDLDREIYSVSIPADLWMTLDHSSLKWDEVQTIKIEPARSAIACEAGDLLAAMTDAESLKQLSIQSVPFDANAVQMLRRFPRLERLELDCGGGTIVDLRPLVTVEHLHATNVQLDDGLASVLGGLPRLRTLGLTNATRSPDTVGFFQGVGQLKLHRLVVERSTVDRTALCGYAAWTKRLRFVGCNFADTSWSPLSPNGPETLSISASQRAEDAFPTIAGWKRLRELSLRRCQTTPDQIDQFSELRRDVRVEAYR